MTEVLRITPTAEQLQVHSGHMRTVSSIVRKKYLTEMDLLRLQKALLMCRMVANSTFLVDKEPPGYSSKLDELDSLLGDLCGEKDRKVVLFSEWTTMLGLIEPLLDKHGAQYVRLDGSVPQKKRQQLVHTFRHDPACKLFILVTEQTIEENLLQTLSAKHALALAALDAGSAVDTVDLVSGMEELKRRLEVLLGARPEAPPDESEKARHQQEAERLARQERIAAAGGQLLGAAFAFLGEMLPPREETDASRQAAAALKQRFAECVAKDEKGRMQLTVTLPDESALDNLAESLARFLGHQS